MTLTLRASVLIFVATQLAACSSPAWVDDYLQYMPPAESAELHEALENRPEAVHALLIESLDPRLDGEAAEIYTAKLIKFLDAVGENRFLVDLQRENPKVQKRVAFYVGPSLKPRWAGLYQSLVFLKLLELHPGEPGT